MEYTYTNITIALFTFLRTLLVEIFIYFGYSYVFANLDTLQVPRRREQYIICVSILLIVHVNKDFQIEVLNFNDICVLLV
jgi:hypothetical protein